MEEADIATWMENPDKNTVKMTLDKKHINKERKMIMLTNKLA